ncbi:hypothetical protein P2318_09180 [Myxococcaceae bacterium GXIMD 01537]
MTRALVLAPLLLALNGCCSEAPRDTFSTGPDRECQTGVEMGLDIAVWECAGQEHVVAYRKSSAFLGCSATTVERVPCGELTPFEKERQGDACLNANELP